MKSYELSGTIEAAKITEVGTRLTFKLNHQKESHEHEGRLPVVVEEEKKPRLLDAGATAKVGDYLVVLDGHSLVLPGAVFEKYAK